MLDEPIHVVPYEPRWSKIASQEIARLGHELGDLVVAFEHFGSTSVPGCAAKPIIDILVGVRTWPPSPALTTELEKLGYEGFGEAGVPGRLYFRSRGPLGFDANLAVTLHRGRLWKTNLLVRELLRREPDLMMDYVQAKQAALRAGCNRLLSYSKHKAQFMDELVERATQHGEGVAQH